MKMHERRANESFPYFKLATWNTVSFTFRDGRVAYGSEQEARSAARKPGRYRISQVNEDGSRRDGEQFDV